MTGTDYQSLIDAETWAFIARTDASYPPDAAQLDVAGQRRVYDAMCAVFAQAYPQGITAQDEVIAGIPCRRYTGAKPAIVYFHGGGFVVGGLHSHDDVCAEIAARTGCEVVSVDYRLSPEHLHPAAYDDACAVTRAMAAEGPVILAGDSAGGNLAAAAAAGLRGQVAPLGQVLIYPGLGGDRSKGSYLTHAQAPMLTLADVNFYAGIRHGGAEPGPDPTVAPLQATDFSGLPPTFALAAECDPLADDAEAYAAALRAAGGEAVSVTAQGMVHGCLRARHQSARAARAFDQICAALSNFAQRSKP
ncbi:MAG: alpha/beta hydrolase [Cypionkella sp.]